MMTLHTFDDLIARIEQDGEASEQLAELKPSRDLAVMLAGIRLQLGLTQTEFARSAGVSQAYVSQLESGTANPSIRRLSSLLRRVGVSLELHPSLPAAAVSERAEEAVPGR